MHSLTRQQAREIDRLAVEKYGIPSILLMENAGRNASDIILNLLEEIGEEHYFKGDEARVAILCGGGNNGGDGYVIARHLYNAGIEVAVFAAVHPENLTGDAAVNANIVRRMDLGPEFILDGAAVRERAEELAEADLIVDALLGTGFTGEVRGHLVELIRLVNQLREDGATTVAIDAPSGLDCDTGKPGASGGAVEADVTVTFVATKAGFLTAGADRFTGRIVEVDIGAPPEETD
jgi:NAD(P)H-hydrate epimerase